MRRFLFVLFVLSSAGTVANAEATATESDDYCRSTREAHASIGAHVSNLMNLRTTRTPEGGPYKPWSCNGGTCVQSSAAPLLKYEPDHPDADENGMVAYPNLNRDEEYQGVLANYAELSILAKLGACGAKYLDVGDIKGVTYADDRIALKWISFVTYKGLVRYVFTANRKKN